MTIGERTVADTGHAVGDGHAGYPGHAILSHERTLSNPGYASAFSIPGGDDHDRVRTLVACYFTSVFIQGGKVEIGQRRFAHKNAGNTVGDDVGLRRRTAFTGNGQAVAASESPLADACNAGRDGHGGEAGIGKSMLADGFQAVGNDHGGQALIAHKGLVLNGF